MIDYSPIELGESTLAQIVQSKILKIALNFLSNEKNYFILLTILDIYAKRLRKKVHLHFHSTFPITTSWERSTHLASFKLNFLMIHSNDTTNFNNQNNITFKVTFGGFTVT